MCGRYIIREQEAADRYWRVHGPPKWIQSFNVAPTATVPIVRRARPGGPAPNEAVLVRWGLVPYWAAGVAPKFPTFNARVEGLATTASFRGPWARGQRCILPAAGFYEWQQQGSRKQPFFVKLADREIFGFAGLWDRSRTAQGMLESCTLITLPANRLLAEIHNTGQRMPAILREEDHEAWLSGTLDDARAALVPYPEDLMVAWPVSPRVSSAKYDDPDLIRPLAKDEADPQNELL
ncbi:MAG: SOS response-associated peptidase [Steroidobacteraceae bacterium]|nr:SOS response-associated peptidase [Steroidobacteraceae bacterium]